MRDLSARGILKVSRTRETSNIPGCYHSILFLQFLGLSPQVSRQCITTGRSAAEGLQRSFLCTPLWSWEGAQGTAVSLQKSLANVNYSAQHRPALCDSLMSLHWWDRGWINCHNEQNTQWAHLIFRQYILYLVFLRNIVGFFSARSTLILTQKQPCRQITCCKNAVQQNFS